MNSISPKKYIVLAESGRGLAALYVFITHLIKYSGLLDVTDSNSVTYYLYYTLGMYGHQAVIFFFLLSGFSIHYSSLDRSLNTKSGLCEYYYLRLRRIYPIYVFAILLSLSLYYLTVYLYGTNPLIKYGELSLRVVFYNVMLLADRSYIEGIIASALPNNGPLWSLSYEVLYYLVYPIFWLIYKKYNTRTVITIAALLSLIAIFYAKIENPNHLTNVFSLYIVWVLGAVVAQLFRLGENSVNKKYLLFCIYILLQSMWVLESAVYIVGAFYDILCGVMFFCIMLYFVDKEDAVLKRYEYAAMIILMVIGAACIDIVSMMIEISKHTWYFYFKIHMTLMLFILMLMSKYDLKWQVKKLLSPHESIGRYSYALYVFHYPIVLFTAMTISQYHISAAYLFLTIPITFMLAIYGEGKYQTFIQKILDRSVLQKIRSL